MAAYSSRTCPQDRPALAFPGVTMDRPLIKLLLLLLAIALAALCLFVYLAHLAAIVLAWALPVAVIALGVAALL